MRTSLAEMSTADLAFCTGHKLTNIHRAYVSAMIGNVYFAKLDGQLQRVTDIRRRLESEYTALEAKQGRPAAR